MFNKRFNLFVIFLFVFCVIFSYTTIALAKGKVSAKYAPDEIIVKFKANVDENQSINRHGGTKVKKSKLGAVKIKIDKKKSLSDALADYLLSGDVEYAEPNYQYTTMLTATDPYYWQQWALPKINAPKAWDITTGSSTVKVAVVDTGVDLSHPDLTANLISGYNAITGGSAQDDHGHGTHVAGIIAAAINNGRGVAGLAPNVKIMPVKVLAANGSGYSSDIAEGIIWSADNGAKVINLSLGSPVPDQTIYNAITYAKGKGVTIVAAAGNDYRGPVSYPAHYQETLAVAATDRYDHLAYFSNIGNEIDVAAPGYDIYSTYWHSGSTYTSLSGTSMATPYVSALAALVIAQNPTFTPDQVRDRITSTTIDIGPPGKDRFFGYGRIDAYKALAPQGNDNFEDNDTSAKAVPLDFNTAYTSSFSKTNDTDWYTIYSSSVFSNLKLNLTVSGGIDPEIYIYSNPADAPIAVANANGDGAGEKINLSGTFANTYYIKIIEHSGRQSNATYTFSVAKNADAYEANDTNVLASVPPNNSTMNLTLDYSGDEDWFVYDVPDGGQMTVNVTPPTNIDLAIQVFDSNLNPVILYDYYAGGVAEGGTFTVDPGRYYFEIYEYTNNNTPNNYTAKFFYNDTTAPILSNVSVAPIVILANDSGANINYTLSEMCNVTIQVLQNTNVVRTITLNNQNAGTNTYLWDGTDGNGNYLSGNVSFRISAVDMNNNNAVPVQTNTIFIDKIAPAVSGLNVTPQILEFTNGQAQISYVLSESCIITAKILSLDGKTVKTLATDMQQETGQNILTWDLRTDDGKIPNDGTYKIQIEARDNPALQQGNTTTVEANFAVSLLENIINNKQKLSVLPTGTVGMTELIKDRIFIQVPQNAFNSAVDITAKKANVILKLPRAQRIAAPVYDFSAEKDGSKVNFSKPITITFKLIDRPPSQGMAAVYYYNETTNVWEKIGGRYNTLDNSITTEVTHFSIYTVLIDDVRTYLPTPKKILNNGKMVNAFDADGKTLFPYEIYLPNEEEPWNYRIHTNYTKNTDACASCHTTHTAVGSSLLQWYNIYETCLACHDGTVTTTYNVVDGKIGTFTAPTYGGHFGVGTEAFLSTHLVNGAVNISAAPGGSAVEESVIKDNGDEFKMWTQAFGCESCHSPHGQGGNARILNPDPNGYATKNNRGRYEVRAVNADLYKVVDIQGNPVTLIKGYPYQIKIMDAGGNDISTYFTISNEGDTEYGSYTTITAKGINKTLQDIAYVIGTASIKVRMQIGAYLQQNETVRHLSGINTFCGACHTDYNTEKIVAGGNSSDVIMGDESKRPGYANINGIYSNAHRHAVGIAWNYGGDADARYIGSDKVMMTMGSSDKEYISCLTCHFAHGTSEKMWSDWTAKFSELSSDGWGNTLSLTEITGSSALKRLPNMATCEACHQKGTANEGYLTNSLSASGMTAATENGIFAQSSAYFVGSAECQKCHPNHYAGWEQTGHARMFFAPSTIAPEVSADWSVYFSGIDIGAVKYVLGSKYKQAYIIEDNGHLLVLPKEWHFPNDAGSGYMLDREGASTWQSVYYENDCIDCHVSGFDETSKQFKEVNITCEACHGPGSNHILVPASSNIFNPQKQSYEKQSTLCGGCHMRGENQLYSYDGRKRTDAAGWSYWLNTQSLFNVVYFNSVNNNVYQYYSVDNAVYYPSITKAADFWPDNSAKNYYGEFTDFIQSKHYVKNILSCTTCHSSHGLSSENKMLKASSYQTCAVCHGTNFSVNDNMPFTAGEYNRRSHRFN